MLARQSKLVDTICLRLANMQHRGIIKLPYKRTSFLSISHSRAPAGYISPGSGDRFSELSFFSLSHSRGRTLSRPDIDERAILKRDLSPGVKFNLSLSLSSGKLRGFPLRRRWRRRFASIVSSLVSAPTRADYSAIGESATTPFYTPAPPPRSVSLAADSSLYLSLRLRSLGTR